MYYPFFKHPGFSCMGVDKVPVHGYCIHMDFISDIAPAASIRTVPTGTLDQADLWEMEQGWAAFMEDTYDSDLPYGPAMEG
jgi:hypothetical protein